MTWGRFDDRMPRHCKYAPLSDAAFRLAVHANLWAREMGTGGFIPRGILPSIVRFGGARLKEAVDELLAAGKPLHQVGIWEADDESDGWWIHDFDDYGPPQERRGKSGDAGEHGIEGRRVDPELSRKRAEAGRRGGMMTQSRRISKGALPSRASLTRASDEQASSPSKATSKLEANGASAASSYGLATGFSEPEPVSDPRAKKPDQATVVASVRARESGCSPSKSEASNAQGKNGSSDSRPAVLPPISHRAQLFLKDPMAAERKWGGPWHWPECQALWAMFRAVWGRRDEPRSSNDPRMTAVMTRYAEGRTQDELVRAIRASKHYPIVADRPEFQRIKTLLKDDEQVDNLLSLEKARLPKAAKNGSKQMGGWQLPAVEVGS